MNNFRVQGSALMLRVRANGTVEPSTWSLEGTNAKITAGPPDLYTHEPNSVDHDLFSAS